MPTEAKAQTSIYETTIEDPELEEWLDERQRLKDKAAEAKQALQEIDERVKTKIRSLDIADAPVRIGNSVVFERHIPGGPVSFEKAASTRIQISLLAENAA